MATIRLRLRELLTQREERENRRIRLSEIAQATGLSTQTVSALVNNQTDRVSLKALAALCEYFGCQPSELLQYVPTPLEDEVVDVRDVVQNWEQRYGADEYPRS